jgi:hypothetical protein
MIRITSPNSFRSNFGRCTACAVLSLSICAALGEVDLAIGRLAATATDRFWRKAVHHETWPTVDGPYDEQSEQCGFACLCDIAAKSTIKEERPWPDRTGNINLRALDYGKKRRSRAFLVRWFSRAMKEDELTH